MRSRLKFTRRSATAPEACSQSFFAAVRWPRSTFYDILKIGRNAVSLGGVETLVCHPNSTTHSGFTREEFETTGMSDGLVRISVGIEDWRDLLVDFEQALASS
jgi:cystathionine beta-lyase/cystathionine gamma-synthase